ncbi:hypothetical protein [Microvirga arabica]|uniref:hypothetical protein n=1 Tax=Microvirga arabica TaxID=1128671 RepID=UPI00366FE524
MKHQHQTTTENPRKRSQCVVHAQARVPFDPGLIGYLFDPALDGAQSRRGQIIGH